MGLSCSKRFHRRHHHHNYDDDHHLPPPPPNSSNSLNPSIPTTPTPPSSHRPPQSSLIPTPSPAPSPPPPPSSYVFAANAPYPFHSPIQTTYSALSTPSLPPPYPPPNNYYSYNYDRPIVTQPTYQPYYIPPPPPTNTWNRFMPAPRLPSLGPPSLPFPAVPYVDHQSAKKIKNDINVRKDSIRLQVDEFNRESHLVCFTFDAMVDGSITILYFAKEGANCTFTSIYPEVKPVKIQFQKGLGQKFFQPSGSGIDLGFFDIDDLSKPLQDDVFPLAIVAASTFPSKPVNERNHEQSVNTSTHAQIALAILEKNNENQSQVKVIKQILWIDRVRYDLREIYGISTSDEETSSDQDTGKECVICMAEPKDTTVLPCRHMCMCSECAKALRLQSNKCPVCRQLIDELLEIKVDEAE